jgi:quinol monooxygenase YgiN
MSIVVIATVTPIEGARDEVAAAYVDGAALVHAESGCELYAVHTTKDEVVLVEKWESGDHLRAHAEGEAVGVIRAKVGHLFAKPTEAVILRPHPDAAGEKGIV